MLSTKLSRVLLLNFGYLFPCRHLIITVLETTFDFGDATQTFTSSFPQFFTALTLRWHSTQ